MLSPADELFWGGGAGSGKGTSLDTLVLTPDGTMPMETIQTGDMVLDEHYQPRLVVSTSDIQHNLDCYEFRFHTGQRVVTDANHRWPVTFGGISPLTGCLPGRDQDRLLTTHQIAALMERRHYTHLVFEPPDISIRAAGGKGDRHGHALVGCQQGPSVPIKCIQVAGPSGLFLITPSAIPTHNSDLLLGLALTCHQRTLILRRQAVQLTALVERLKEIVGTSGQWRGSGHGGTMRVGTRIIELGGCDHEDDKIKYQGRPHDLVAADELPHFSRSQIRFISGWNRTDLPHQRCRFVGTGNPPTTPEGRWVVEEWAPWLDIPVQAVPGQMRWYTYIDGKIAWFGSGETIFHDGESIKPRSRTFIPATVHDNPVYMQTDYLARLQALEEPLRSQMLYGDFGAGTEDNAWQVIPTAWVRLAQQRWSEDGGREFPITCVGVDVARGGAAKTVLAKRYGPWVAPLLKYPGKSTPDGPWVASLMRKAIEYERPDTLFHIDAIGVGSSPYDKYREYPHANIRAINNGARTNRVNRTRTMSFTNIRAYSYWYLREALDPEKGDGLMLPPDPELLADLCAPRFEIRPSGVLIESKEDIAKRLGRSTDCGDAVVLCLIPPATWEAPSSMAAAPLPPPGAPSITMGSRLGARLPHRRRLFGG